MRFAGLIVLLAATSLACNAISGIGTFTYDRDGGGPACDSLGTCGNVKDPSSCEGCAAAGACKGAVDACSSYSPCQDLTVCESACNDATCEASCEASYPTGKADYVAQRDCLACACPVTCTRTCP